MQPDAADGHAYKFEVHTDHAVTLRADPMAQQAEVPPLTASVLGRTRHEWREDEAAFRWQERAPGAAPGASRSTRRTWARGATTRRAGA